MKIPAHEAFQYKEVHRVVEYRNDAIYRTAPTGVHVTLGTEPPVGCILADISAKPGEIVTINLLPTPIL